jgi:hypothetical protein
LEFVFFSLPIAVADHTKLSTLIYGGVLCVKMVSIIFTPFAIVLLPLLNGPGVFNFLAGGPDQRWLISYTPCYPNHHRTFS